MNYNHVIRRFSHKDYAPNMQTFRSFKFPGLRNSIQPDYYNERTYEIPDTTEGNRLYLAG